MAMRTVPSKAVVGGLEMRNWGQFCSPSRLEGECLCVSMSMSYRRKYLDYSVEANLASELIVVEQRTTCEPEVWLCAQS